MEILKQDKTPREQSVSLPAPDSIGPLTTREAVDTALDQLCGTETEFIAATFDPAYLDPGVNRLEAIRARVAEPQRVRMAIVDRVIEAYTAEEPNEGQARLREVAAAVGGIDQDVDQVTEATAELSILVSRVRGSVGRVLPHTAEIDNDALFTNALPVLGFEELREAYGLQLAIVNIAKNIVALSLIQGKMALDNPSQPQES